MQEIDTIIRNAKTLYEEIMYQNAEAFRTLRTGNYADAKAYLKEYRESVSVQKDFKGFSFALDWINLISPRYYIQGVDITLAMREKIWLDDYAKDDGNWSLFKKAVKEYEFKCFQDYMNCIVGQPPNTHTEYYDYLCSVREVNEYLGEAGTENPQVDNAKAFRLLVKRALDDRKKCQIVVNFTNRFIPIEKRVAYSKETLTLDDALELCEEIIDNIDCIEYSSKSKKKRSFQEMDVNEADIINTLVHDAEDDILEEQGLRSQIMDSFVTNFLEHCGVSRRIYSKYFKDEGYFPDKKLCLAMGIFLEPYTDLSKEQSADPRIADNLECFMNQNYLSIKSKFGTVSELDILLDYDVLCMLEDGLSTDVIAFMLNTYARTEKDFN